jgi:hypothetical protein
VVIEAGYGLDDRGVGVRVPVEARIFYFPVSSRPTLGSTQPPIQWVPGALSSGVKASGGVKLTAHLQLVPRSSKCGSIYPLPIRLHGVVLN